MDAPHFKLAPPCCGYDELYHPGNASAQFQNRHRTQAHVEKETGREVVIGRMLQKGTRMSEFVH